MNSEGQEDEDYWNDKYGAQWEEDGERKCFECEGPLKYSDEDYCEWCEPDDEEGED